MHVGAEIVGEVAPFVEENGGSIEMFDSGLDVPDEKGLEPLRGGAIERGRGVGPGQETLGPLGDDLRADVQAKRDAYEGLIRGIVTDGISSGEFRADADVAMTARLVLSAGNWVYAWYRPEGSLSSTEIGHRYTEMIVRGLKNDSIKNPADAGDTEVAQ